MELPARLVGVVCMEVGGDGLQAFTHVLTASAKRLESVECVCVMMLLISANLHRKLEDTRTHTIVWKSTIWLKLYPSSCPGSASHSVDQGMRIHGEKVLKTLSAKTKGDDSWRKKIRLWCSKTFHSKSSLIIDCGPSRSMETRNPIPDSDSSRWTCLMMGQVHWGTRKGTEF